MRHIRKSSLALLAICLLVGCGGSSDATAPTPAPEQITGSWAGNYVDNTGSGTFVLNLGLSESRGTVTGSGNFAATSGVVIVNLTAQGTWVSPSISLSLSEVGFSPTVFVGTVHNGVMDGYMNGSGFQNQHVVLMRR